MIAAALLAIGWLGTCPAAAGTPPPMGAHSFAYDGHHYSEVRTYTTTERGPPASPALHTAYDADDHRSRGTLARPDGATSPAATQYAPAVTVAQGAASTTTTGRPVRLADGTFCALYRGSVAANTGPRVWTNLAPKDPLFPGRAVPLDRLSSINGRFQYVVGQDGRLIVGRGGHIDLARGSGVTAAGEVRLVNGEVRMFNNASGHYQPDASIQDIARTAFVNAGLTIRSGAWQAVTH